MSDCWGLPEPQPRGRSGGSGPRCRGVSEPEPGELRGQDHDVGWGGLRCGNPGVENPRGALSAFLGRPPPGGEQNPGEECGGEETRGRRGGRGAPEWVGCGWLVAPGKGGRGFSEKVDAGRRVVRKAAGVGVGGGRLVRL